jgi:hypothetical protein
MESPVCGHNQTFKLAVAMIKGFGLDIPTALAVLSERYNSRCQQPRSPEELEHKVQEACWGRLRPTRQPSGILWPLGIGLQSSGRNHRRAERWYEVLSMSEEEIKALVWRTATESADRGPGWAQEGVVLRMVRERVFGSNDPRRANLKTQQMILDAWHDLFTEKKLAWGYDLDNPGAPFFHVR